MSFNEAQGWYDFGRDWGDWLYWLAPHRNLEDYREGRLTGDIMRDGHKYPRYARCGAEVAAVVKGVIREELVRQGTRRDEAEKQLNQVGQAVLMARRITQLGAQITKVADSANDFWEALLLRSVRPPDEIPGDSNQESPFDISVHIWMDGILVNFKEHVKTLVIAFSRLVLNSLELWQCWLDIEDARAFQGDKITHYALHCAPLHVCESIENLVEIKAWARDKFYIAESVIERLRDQKLVELCATNLS